MRLKLRRQPYNIVLTSTQFFDSVAPKDNCGDSKEEWGMNWRFLGPICVIIGSCLWGTESYFRIELNQHFQSNILVWIEHGFCLLWTIPFLFSSNFTFRGCSVRSWIYIILSGSLGSAIGTYFFTEGLRTLNSSVANILLNFQPLVAVGLATVLLGERLSPRFFVWAFFALLCGLAIVIGHFALPEFQISKGLFYIGLTALSWGLSTVAGRGARLEMPLVTAVFVRLLAGFVTLFVMIAFQGGLSSISPPQVGEHWMSFVGLSLFAGTLPTFLYFKGLAFTSASAAAFCEMAQTFAALIITWGVIGDPLTPLQCVAGVLLLFAIYKINTAPVRSHVH